MFFLAPFAKHWVPFFSARLERMPDYTIHYTLYTIHYTLYTIQYTLSIHYTLYTIYAVDTVC